MYQNGNIRRLDPGANLTYVDMGDGNMELCHDRLAKRRNMSLAGFSNDLPLVGASVFACAIFNLALAGS